MHIQEITSGDFLYQLALELRYQLFFAEFGFPKEVTCDDLEDSSRHFVIAKSHSLIAYARLTELEPKRFKISQVVVETDEQHKGYGSSLVNNLVKCAVKADAELIELNSQVTANSFYNQLGFNETGDTYQAQLTGIHHIRMVLDPLRQQEI